MPTFSRTQAFGHHLGTDGRVTINVTDADLHVEGVDGEEVQVQATFDIRATTDAEADAIFEAAQLRVTRASRTLQVEQPDEHRGFRGLRHELETAVSRIFGGSGVEVTVQVEVPRAAEVRVVSVSGDVDVSDLVGDGRYETVSGDLSISDGSGNLRINTVSGDAQVRARDAVSIRAETVSGDLGVSAPRLEMFRATTVSGDIDLEGELAAQGEFRAETVSGDLSVGLAGGATFDVRGLSTDIRSDLDHRIEGRLDRRRLVVGSGGPQFIFSSMSGDLAVRRPRRIGDGPRMVPSTPPGPPSPPAPPVPRAPIAPVSGAAQLEILQALERGEIDVEEATRRLAGGTSDAR